MSRDFNSEISDNERKYAYSFDYDVIHGYMIKAFKAHFRTGAALELGCYQGAFTERLIDHFDDITSIDASSDALSEAKKKQKLLNVRFVEGTFENTVLYRKYENIFLTHVLEHVDDRIALLKKIRELWLADGGAFYVACPNAYAPSRQIAVHMGLVEYPEAVTESEKAHGHRVTYSMETLENDLLSAGFTIKDSSGIFFKALANFQWDKLLYTDIISQEYIDGCYELGKKYPNLCSSIYCICE